MNRMDDGIDRAAAASGPGHGWVWPLASGVQLAAGLIGAWRAGR